MCIEVEIKAKAKEDFLAYKVVQKIRDGVYTSICKPSRRDPQEKRSRSVNKTLTYRMGKATISSFKCTAGIYIYTTRERARDTYRGKDNRKILQVKVKKGTMCWFNDWSPAMCAERIEIIKEVR